MKCLFKAYSVLLMVASDKNDSIDKEELEALLDLCDGFLTEKEVSLLSENSILGKEIEVESLFEKLGKRYIYLFQSNSVS